MLIRLSFVSLTGKNKQKEVSMAPRKRKKTSIVFGIPIIMMLVLIGFSMFWLKATTLLEDYIDLKTTEWKEMGIEFSFKEKELKGFPYSASIALKEPSFKMPSKAGGMEIKFSELEMHVSPLSIQTINITPNGNVRIKTSDRFDASEIELNYDLFDFNVSINPLFEITYASIELKNLTAKGFRSGGTLEIEELKSKIAKLYIIEASFQDITFTADFSIKNMNVSPNLGLPIGGNMEKIIIKADILGPIKTNNIIRGLEKWRTSGGTAEIRKVQLNWEPLKLRMSGTLALDYDFQPIGTLTGRSIGVFETLPSFIEAGLIQPRDASMVKIVIGKNATAKTKKGLSKTSLSLSIQDSILYIGPVKLAELPIIDWTLGLSKDITHTKK